MKSGWLAGPETANAPAQKRAAAHCPCARRQAAMLHFAGVKPCRCSSVSRMVKSAASFRRAGGHISTSNRPIITGMVTMDSRVVST